MLQITDLKTGVKVSIENQPYTVLSYQHHKMGRGGAVVKTKLKNLITNATVDKTFQGADKIEEADLATKVASFLYSEKDQYHFMDETSFEQFSLNRDQLGNFVNYLVDGTSVSVLYYNDQPINIELPIKMDFEVVEAPPGVKGNTASGATKNIKLETGITISAPLFIHVGDRVRIDTRNGQYLERA